MPTDEDRWPCWLDWLREPTTLHCAIGAALERSLLVRPEKAEQLDPIFQLLQPLLERPPGDARCLVIMLASTCTQTQHEPSSRHYIQRRRHFRQHSWVPVRMREDHGDRPNITGLRRHHREGSPTFQARSSQQVI